MFFSSEDGTEASDTNYKANSHEQKSFVHQSGIFVGHLERQLYFVPVDFEIMQLSAESIVGWWVILFPTNVIVCIFFWLFSPVGYLSNIQNKNKNIT